MVGLTLKSVHRRLRLSQEHGFRGTEPTRSAILGSSPQSQVTVRLRTGAVPGYLLGMTEERNPPYPGPDREGWKAAISGGAPPSWVGPLRQDERVVWTGRPSIWCFKLNGLWMTVFFFVFLYVLGPVLLVVFLIAIPELMKVAILEPFAWFFISGFGLAFLFVVYDSFVRPVRLMVRIAGMRYAVTTDRALIVWRGGKDRQFIEPGEMLWDIEMRRSILTGRGTIRLTEWMETRNHWKNQGLREAGAFWRIKDPEGALQALQAIRHKPLTPEEIGIWQPRFDAPLGKKWDKPT